MSLALLWLSVLIASLPSASAIQDPSPTIKLHGKVTVVDGTTAHEAASGRITLWCDIVDTEDREVDVTSGQFELELPRGSKPLSVGRMTLEGRGAFSTNTWRELPIDGVLSIEARFLTPATLRVIAKDSGRELSRCQLVRGPSADLISCREEFKQSSPVTLDPWDEVFPFAPWRRMGTWFVRAPGYAWASASIDYEVGGETKIELAPAGVLVITPIVPKGVMPVMLDVDGPSNLSFRRRVFPGDGEFAIESLPPGTYRLTTIPTDQGSHSIDKRGSIELSTADVAHFTLDLTPAPITDPARLAGTIVFDPSWRSEAPAMRLSVSRLDDATHRYNGERNLDPRYLIRDPNDPTKVSFTAGDVRPGTWLAFVEPFQYSHVFQLAPGAKDPIHIEIPARVHVRAHVVERVTKKAIPVTSVGWYCMPPPEPSTVMPAQAVWNDAESAYTFDAPAGEIVLYAGADGYTAEFQPVRVSAAENEVAIELSPVGTIRIALHEGERHVPFPDSVYPRATRIDDKVREIGRGFDYSGLFTLTVAEAGRYRVEVPELADYAALEPQLVDVEPGKLVDVVFQLTRRK